MTSLADRQLLLALQSIENPHLRRTIVKNLDSRAREKLCKHICKFVKQSSPLYKLCEEHDKNAIKQALAPHKKSIQKILQNPKLAQKGSGIFTILASALVPVLTQLISSAISKKK